ncbi:MAG: thiamine pyrophosphate-binding protein [Anaerolineales bacterium]
MARSIHQAEATAPLTLTIASAIAKHLAAVGVQRIYGLPGGEMLDLLEACRQEGIEFILTHHESAAAFMAAAEGRYRRAPSACIATLGPGATNMVSGVAHAYLDRCPVIAISASTSISFRDDHTHQNLQLDRLFRSITKRSAVLEPETAPSVIAESVALAASEPFGPVSLHVPRDLAMAEVSEEPVTIGPPMTSPAGDLSLQELADRLNGAKAPLVVIGLATPPEATEDVRRFVEAYRAPVGVTPKVKGIVDETQPLFAGVYGGVMAESIVTEFMAGRDLVFCLGLDPTEVDIDWLGQERFVWLQPSLNIDQTALPRATHVSDLSSGLSQLLPMLNTSFEDGPKDAANVRQALRERLETAIPADLSEMSPLRTLDALAQAWPASDPVCCDVGAHKLLISQCWPSSMPNRFFISNGLSSMGYGISAPIALHLASDGLPVLAVIGDGGLLMYAGELETAARLGAHVMFVVFFDGTLALIERSQTRLGYPMYGMHFRSPDVHALGRAFRIPTSMVTNEAALIAAVEDFRHGEGPALVAVSIDPREYHQQG